MGSLRSALDEITVQDLRVLGDDQLADHIAEIERATRALEAERARAIAEIDDRRAFAADGFLSPTTWLAHRFGLASSLAAQHVRLARALRSMPVTRAALGDGAISVAAAGLLVDAREGDPETFRRTESLLVISPRRSPSAICVARSTTGVSSPMPRRQTRSIDDGSTVAGSSSPPRWTAWSASTAISIPRPDRP